MKKLLLILFLFSSLFAQQNLDELVSRVSRKSVNTFYNAENDAANNGGNSDDYVWQPQMVVFKDTISNHEVILWTQTNNVRSVTANEYGNQPWSADGKRFSLQMNTTTGAFTKGGGYWEYLWLTMRSDGSYMRVMPNSAARVTYRDYYADWSPTKPDTMYKFGRNYSGASGYDLNGIYRVIVNDTTEASTLIVDLIGGNTTTFRGSIKDNITSDGRYMVGMAWAETEPIHVALIDSTSPEEVLSYSVPELGTYWWNTPADESHFHDEMLVGNRANGYWFYGLYTTGSWWRIRLWGSDGNAPNHTTDTSSPYDWWVGTASQTEVQPVNGVTGTAAFTVDYWSHGVPGRLGNCVAHSNTESGVGPGVWDVENQTELSDAGGEAAQYHVWTGFTDWTTGSGGDGSSRNAYSMKYNDDGTHITTFFSHSVIVNEYTKPGQSPDGTKTAFHSNWLNTYQDVFVVASYFPYPPEMTSCTATGGTVTINFDWQFKGDKYDGICKKLYDGCNNNLFPYLF